MGGGIWDPPLCPHWPPRAPESPPMGCVWSGRGDLGPPHWIQRASEPPPPKPPPPPHRLCGVGGGGFQTPPICPCWIYRVHEPPPSPINLFPHRLWMGWGGGGGFGTPTCAPLGPKCFLTPLGWGCGLCPPPPPQTPMEEIKDRRTQGVFVGVFGGGGWGGGGERALGFWGGGILGGGVCKDPMAPCYTLCPPTP